MSHTTTVRLFVLLAAFAAAHAASPPDLLNYQGVLRDTSDNPLDGDYDMSFRFFDSPTGGAEILVDEHLAAGTGAVGVTNGLFSVGLGGGRVLDGSGPGTYVSLAEVFRDYTEVWLTVEVKGEELSPRTRVLSAGYALNADHLDGSDSSFFLNTSATPQSKAGPLTVEGAIESTTGGFTFPDGSVQTAAALPENLIHTVDALGSVGQYSALVVGDDGDAVISYYDGTAPSLDVALCGDPSCTSAVLRTVDPGTSIQHTSIALRRGNAVVSYYDVLAQNLKALFCNDPECSSFTDVALDGPGVGEYSSIAVLPGDDSVVVSYYDRVNTALKFARCSAPGCPSPTIRTLDSLDDVGLETSIAVGADGNPVISYGDATNVEVKVADCADPDCVGVTLETVTVGADSSIAVRRDGRPILAIYVGPPGDDLVAADCADASCIVSTFNTLDAVGDVGSHPSIALAPSGNPVISYYDETNRDLKLAECADEGCAKVAILRLDADDNVGQYNSVGIGPDGKAVVSYYDQTNRDLKLITHVTGQVGQPPAPLAGPQRTDGTAGDRLDTTGRLSTRIEVAPKRASLLPRPRDPGAGIRTDAEGNVYARSFRPSAGDSTRLMRIAEPVEPGDVLVIDPERPGLMSLSRTAEDSAVVGVVAGEPGVVLGVTPPVPAEPGEESREPPEVAEPILDVPVALSSVVLCKVDAGYGAVRPGDLLTTSPTPGHAMLAHDPRPGTILGKALESLDSGKGLIEVLVTLR
jgi:hypothetical protein